jgi:two-component system, NarL family, nitrate/nitrite response regulator NarL
MKTLVEEDISNIGAKYSNINILLASEHALVRGAMRALLESLKGLKVVGDTPFGPELTGLLNQLQPNLLLLDLDTLEPKEMDCLITLMRARFGVPTMVVVARVEIPQALEALQSGISGIIMKRSSASMLLEAIRNVAGGIRWVDPALVSDLLAHYQTLAPPTTVAARADCALSARERQVLAEIIYGGSNRKIAERLSISDQTVKHHLTRIFRKIGVSSRLELALFGIKHELAQPGQVNQ